MPYSHLDEDVLLGVTTQRTDPNSLPTPRDVDFFTDLIETLPAAFRAENTIWSFATNGMPDFLRDDPNFRPFDHIEGYREYSSAFIGASSLTDVQSRKDQIDREIQDRQTLMQAGAPGMLATLAAGFLDPLILLPVGGAVAAGRGGSILRRGVNAMYAGGLGATATEVSLQASSATRTYGESIMNVGAATVLSGVLGGAVGALDDALRGRALQMIENDLGDTARVHGDESVYGAAGRGGLGADRPDGPRLVLSDDPAQRPDQVASAMGVENLGAILKVNPVLRIAIKSPSDVARGALRVLVNPGFKYKSELAGVAAPISVANKVAGWRGPLGQAIEFRDRLYVRYITGAEPGQEGGKVARAKIRLGDAGRRIRGQELDHLSWREFNEEIAVALRSGDTHEIAEIGEIARYWRKEVYDPLLERLQAQGRIANDFQTVGAPSYLTRVYNPSRLIEMGKEFREEVAIWLRASRDDEIANFVATEKNPTAPKALSETDAANAAQQIQNKILGLSGGRMLYENVQFAGIQALKERTLTIPDEILLRLGVLETDAEVLLRSYVRTVASDVELFDGLRAFGDTEAAFRGAETDDSIFDQIGLAKAIRDEYDQRIAALDDQDLPGLSDKERKAISAQKQKLARSRELDLKDIRHILAEIRGTTTSPADPTGSFVRAGRFARGLNFLTVGGQFALSALPDLARFVMVNGLGRTFRTVMIPMISNWQGIKMSSKELRLAGEALDLIIDSRARAIADIGDDFGRFSKSERFLEAATNTFGVVTGLAPWNQMMKNFAGVTTQSRIWEVADQVARGVRVAKRDRAALAHLGLDDAMLRRIHNQQWQQRGTLRIADTEAWSDAGAREAYRASLRQSVNEIIVTPGVGDRPKFFGNEWGKLLGQFKSFAYASVNRTTLPMLQDLRQGDLAALNGIGMALFLGSQVYAVKQLLNGRELPSGPDAWRTWANEAIDRSGLLGIFSEFNAILEKGSRGRLGIGAVLGGPLLSRYASRNIMGTFAGPSFGQFNDFATGVGALAAGEFLQSDTRRFRRTIPYQNVAWGTHLFDRMEEAVNRSFNIPARRVR